MITFDFNTGKKVEKLCCNNIANIDAFLQQKCYFIIKNYKALILKVFDYTEIHPYPVNILFSLNLAKTLKHWKVPFYFLSDEALHVSAALIGDKCISQTDDTIMVILVNGNELTKLDLRRKSDGYICVRYEKSECSPNPKDVCRKRLNTNNCKQTIATNISSKAESKKLLKLLKDQNVTVLEDYFQLSMANVLIEITKYICDKSYNKYNYFQKRDQMTFISRKMYMGSADDFLLPKQNAGIKLPFTDTCIVPRIHNYFYICILNDDMATIVTGEKTLKEKCHQIKVTFTIDRNQLPSFKQEPIILESIKNLPKTLNEKCKDSRIPVIGFLDNLSVICIWNEKENSYKFLDSWNGLDGKNLFLSFENEKPEIVDRALDIEHKKPPHIVYRKISKLVLLPKYIVSDLLKIMSMPSNNIQTDTEWGFDITKDEDNPVLLEFDSHDGSKKAASPAFLMAILLKEHKKVIKNEIGKKPKEFGFCIFGDFNAESQKRVEKELKAACELKKDICHFINA
uniref:Uncharacterized protein n=1 Tax=Panagrolaimus davidi TaxID=227884 RepID=A0A914QQ48_9BILA